MSFSASHQIAPIQLTMTPFQGGPDAEKEGGSGEGGGAVAGHSAEAVFLLHVGVFTLTLADPRSVKLAALTASSCSFLSRSLRTAAIQV